MHPVLSTAELLLAVFQWIPGDQLLAVALVNRSWSEWALDLKWRTGWVPFKALVSLLGTLDLIRLNGKMVVLHYIIISNYCYVLMSMVRLGLHLGSDPSDGIDSVLPPFARSDQTQLTFRIRSRRFISRAAQGTILSKGAHIFGPAGASPYLPPYTLDEHGLPHPRSFSPRSRHQA